MGCATILREILTSAKGEIRLGLGLSWLSADRGGRSAHFRKKGSESKPSVAFSWGPSVLTSSHTRILHCRVVVSGETCDSEPTYNLQHLSVQS